MILSGGAHRLTHWEEEHPVVSARSDWWLARDKAWCPLFYRSYSSGNNSQYFLWNFLLFCFYLHTLDCVCWWMALLWSTIQDVPAFGSTASSKQAPGFHPALVLLFSLSIFLGRCSFPAWHWQYLQCLSWTSPS